MRRVRGLSKCADSENISDKDSIDKLIMPGDPLLVKIKGELRICQIKCMKKANKKMKILNVEEINDHNVSFEVIIMKMENYRNSYIWASDFIGDTFITAGLNVYVIQPSLSEIEGKLRYTFDKQFILDLNIDIGIEKNENPVPSSVGEIKHSYSETPSSSSESGSK